MFKNSSNKQQTKIIPVKAESIKLIENTLTDEELHLLSKAIQNKDIKNFALNYLRSTIKL